MEKLYKCVYGKSYGFHRQKGNTMENSRIYSYSRISTNKKSQKIDRQEFAMKKYAEENNFTIDKYFSDVITGGTKAENRPNYYLMRQEMRSGDTLIITDVDRLGRNADDVIMEIKTLQSEGIRVVALDVPYMNEWKAMHDDSLSKMIIDIFLTLKAHIAEQEKAKIHDRIMQGLETAKAKNIKLGRKPIDILPDDFMREYKKFKAGEYGKITATQFAKLQGIGRSTLYKYIKLLGSGKIGRKDNECGRK